MNERWEAAFVALSAIVGEPLEAITLALGTEGVAHASDLVRALGSPSRETRARALARAVSEVVLAVDGGRHA